MQYSEFLTEYQKFRYEFCSAYAFGSPNQNIAVGSFTIDELDIFLPFINDNNLSWLGERSFLLNKYYFAQPEQERHRKLLPEEIEALDATGTDIIKIIGYIEVTNHEHFHALQTLTLQSVWQFVFAFQEIAHVRTSAALYLIAMGRKFAENKSIFGNLLDSDCDQIFRRKALGLVHHFETIRTAIHMDSDGLSTLGLIENSALIAQKISCRSFSFDTVREESIYSNSFAYWKRHGGKNGLAFLIAAHSALRLGSLNAGHGEVSPVDIFREYAKNAMDIEEALAMDAGNTDGNTDNWAAAPLSRSFGLPRSLSASDLINAMKAESAQEMLHKNGIYKALKNGLEWGEDNLAHLFPANEKELTLKKMTQLNDLPQRCLETAQQMLLKLPAAMVKKVSILHPISRIKLESDVYIANIGSRVYENIPGFYSEKYFLNWLFDDQVREEFQTLFKDVSFDEEPEQIELDTMALSIFEFRILVKFISDVEVLMMYDPDAQIPLPNCCAKHRSTEIDILLDCEEPDSLNSRCRRMLGKPLTYFLNL